MNKFDNLINSLIVVYYCLKFSCDVGFFLVGIVNWLLIVKCKYFIILIFYVENFVYIVILLFKFFFIERWWIIKKNWFFY